MDIAGLDPAQLAKLTRKIEAGLGKPTKPNVSERNHPNSKKEPSKSRQRNRGQGPPNSDGRANAGTKRDIRGKARPPPRTASDASKPSQGTQVGASNKEGAHGQLMQEVLELGGTEEDLNLVADAQSESEIDENHAGSEKSSANPKDLHKDVATFIHSLGMQGNSAPDDHVPKNASESARIPKERKERRKADVDKKATSSAAKGPERPTKPTNTDAVPKANSSRLLFTPRPDWYAAELPRLPHLRENPSSPSQALLKQLHDHALQLLQVENDRYSSAETTSSSSRRFIKTIMTSGTLSDKVSALTLVIQESPLHAMKALENLLALARKRSRGQAVSALGALKDLLAQGELLPSGRRLRPFTSQPELIEALQGLQPSSWRAGNLLPGEVTEVHLVFWAYEDWLKTTYYEVVRLLEVWCNDEVEYARARALGYVYELLTHKPEQEVNLLRLLVNKLGDVDKKIASKASYLLLQLSAAHPLMKPIIISTIESDLVFRPRQSLHAIYYATITLNQTELTGKEEHLAVQLLNLYFRLFATMLKDSDGQDLQDPTDATTPAKDRKGKAGRSNGKPSTGKKGAPATINKQDGEFKEKIVSAVLTGVNRALPYAGSDKSIFHDHLNTLFRITHSSNFNSSVQALMLLQQLSTSARLASDRFYRTLYESLLDPRLLTSSKQALYLNLLFKSLRNDLNLKRVKAFVKRIVQLTALHQPPFACAALYLVKELEEHFSGLHGLIDQPEGYYDGDEEHFRDVPEEAEAGNSMQNAPSEMDTHLPEAHVQRPKYDGRKRDPQYCNADRSCLWELIPCIAHFHPSIKLFATRLLLNEPKPAKPDLSLHTLIHFLDRFVYRNVKTTTAPRGASIMQPLLGENVPGMVLMNKDTSKVRAPLNAASFVAKKPEEVSVDEVFFHKYFSQVGHRKQFSERKAARKQKDAQDDEDREEDGNDEEIWKAIVGSRPDLGEVDDGGDDMDLDDSDFSEDDDVEFGDDASELGSDVDVSIAGDLPEDGPLDEESEAEEVSFFPDEEDVPADPSPQVNLGPQQGRAHSQESRRAKRRKLKDLPTFASAEDYASMLADDDEV